MLSSYLNQTNFFAYLVEDNLSFDETMIPGSVMIKTMKNITQFGDNYGTMFTARIAFKLSELPYISSLDNLKLIYLIQNEETKSIDLAGVTDYLIDIEYEDLVDSDDEEIPATPLVLNVYPNPFYQGDGVTIKVMGNDREYADIELDIYNLKGQKIRHIASDSRNENRLIWNGLDENQKKSASGIYFVRVISKSRGEIRSAEKKILLLND